MKTSEPGITKVGDNVWDVRVEGMRGRDGKRNQQRQHVRGSFEDAKRARALLLVKVGRVTKEARMMTVAEAWYQVYRPSVSGLARSTLRGYDSSWSVHIEPTLAGLRMCELDKRRVQVWVNGIEKPGAARAAFKTLRQLTRYCMSEGIIDRDPTMGVKLPRKPEHEPVVYGPRELAVVLDAMRGEAIEPVVIIMCAGGLRREEACALLWEDIAFREAVGIDGKPAYSARVSVEKTILQDKHGVYVDRCKTERSRRTVTISEPFAGRLHELAGMGPVVPDTGSRDELHRMEPETVARTYKRIVRGLDIPWTPLTNLRHSCATMMRDAGVDATIIAQVLGHTSTAMVYRHYFSRANRAVDAAADALGEAMRGIM